MAKSLQIISSFMTVVPAMSLSNASDALCNDYVVWDHCFNVRDFCHIIIYLSCGQLMLTLSPFNKRVFM